MANKVKAQPKAAVYTPLDHASGDNIGLCQAQLPNGCSCWVTAYWAVTDDTDPSTYYQLCDRHAQIQQGYDDGSIPPPPPYPLQP